jgi:hypothetical protein
MNMEEDKVVVHLELSRQAAALLYALNQHALKRPSTSEPEDQTDVLDSKDNFETDGIAETVRTAFIGKHDGYPLLSFSEAHFDELTRELGTTVWDALH